MPTHLGVDDENPLWISGIRQFTDFYCLWDSVRNANSFISLFDPDLETELLNALLDIGDHTGWIPDAWIAGHSAMIQGGCSADILFCEAALKGLKGIDYNKALKHMRRGAETVSPNPNLYGRYTEEYAELGYLSTRIGNCVSRHLEYAYQDWFIGTLARLLDKDEVASKYMESSKKAWNLWREDIKAFAPKKPDGSWVEPFDPKGCRPDSWNDPFFYEGTSIQWSFSVHHDFHGLIRKHGGPEAFIRHLDEFFDVSKLENPLSFPRAHYFSKETMLHIPYLYTYAGRPDC